MGRAGVVVSLHLFIYQILRWKERERRREMRKEHFNPAITKEVCSW